MTPENAVKALNDILALHALAKICRGCCSTRCPGDCDWSDEYDGELMNVCSICCIDMNSDRRNDECLDYHEHGEEHGDKPACSTVEIIHRADTPTLRLVIDDTAREIRVDAE